MLFTGGNYASGAYPSINLPDGYTSDNCVILSFGVLSDVGQWYYDKYPITLESTKAYPQWTASPYTNNTFRLVLLKVK